MRSATRKAATSSPRIEDKIKKTKLSKEAREKATHELKKLRQISPMSPEGAVVRNYPRLAAVNPVE